MGAFSIYQAKQGNNPSADLTQIILLQGEP